MTSVHSLRPDDTKTLLREASFRSESEGTFDVGFWQVNSEGAVQGVGFTITGSKRTDFLTWSSFGHGSEPQGVLHPGAVHVFTADEQVHQVHDLCTRGLKLSKEETARFIATWADVFEIYLCSRRAAPPKTYSWDELQQHEWGRKVRATIDGGLRSPVAGPVTGREVARELARKDLA